jgi:hypothetical protein
VLARRRALGHFPSERETGMKHYRVNKLAKPEGHVVKRKDILASNDHEAVQRAEGDPDCPICDVWHAGEKVGSIT